MIAPIYGLVNYPAIAQMVDFGVLLRRITGLWPARWNGSSFFGLVPCLLRITHPELVENTLMYKLLAEQEDVVGELWREPLDVISNDLFSGRGTFF